MTSKPLIEYATTDRQRQIAEVYEREGTEHKAAKVLGVSRSTINDVMSKLKVRAALHGDSPAHDLLHPAAPGFSTRRVSTAYDRNGEIAIQWHTGLRCL